MSDLGRFRVIGASAGTGKTHRLTSLVLEALGSAIINPAIAPEALVGMTFTRKAAQELIERLRTRLYAAGQADLAQRLGMAYLGTTHSVGLRLVAEYAVEAGLSPEIGVLPEDGQRFVHTLLEQVLSEDEQQHLDALARRLRIRWDTRQRTVDWPKDVFEIVDAARANRIRPEALPAMAERSWRTLAEHLDPRAPDGTVLDRALYAALDDAGRTIDPNRDKTHKTRELLERLPELRHELDEGVWAAWAHLAKVDLGKPSYPQRDALRAAASRVGSHPRLHDDLRAYLEATYAAAAAMMSAFAAWKAAAHVVDHTDQLDLALGLLDVPAVAAELSSLLDLVVVDELQDSTPLQLALHMRLHTLAGRSVWVGDPKQCIFEWNGADPGLVDVVLDAIGQAGGEVESLALNRRSRPELTELTSLLFAGAFADHGLRPEDVAVEAHRVDPPELAPLAPLALAFSAAPFAEAAADTVLALITSETPVSDRASGEVRQARPGDVAVLAATNENARRVADALAARGIRTATARDGLLATPEAVVVRAALSLLVAPDDALAEAELDALLGRDGGPNEVAARRDTWLASRIAAVVAQEGRTHAPWAAALGVVRRELPALSPAAAFERVLEVLDLSRRALGWPEPALRVANLDALRRLAREYEALETARRRPPTLSGFLRALAAVAEGEADTPLTDQQHVAATPDVVQIMTYHRAKGLEWPIVVMTGLDGSKQRSPFTVACESDATSFSLTAPLASRWVRHWPWPFAPTRSGELEARVSRSEIGLAVGCRDRRERVRLLYVGFTRARDHLVLCVPEGGNGQRKTAWLDELKREGRRVWRFGADPQNEFEIERDDGSWRPIRTRRVLGPAAVPHVSLVTTHEALAAASTTAHAPKPRRDLSPSSATPDDLTRLGVAAWAPRGPVVRLGPRLAVDAPRGFSDWDRLGTAIHGFLASDVGGDEPAARRARAEVWAAAHATEARVAPEILLEAAERWHKFVANRWPGAHIAREIPIESRISDSVHSRRTRGVIDQLLLIEDGWVVVDHKSFPAPEAAWNKAKALAAQLALYAHALESLPEHRKVAAVFLHFPLAGVVIELAPESARVDLRKNAIAK